MAIVALGGYGQKPVVDLDYAIVALGLVLPANIGIPELVRTELQATCRHRSLVLGTDELLVLSMVGLDVHQVVDPQIHRKRYRLQAALKHLGFVQFRMFGTSFGIFVCFSFIVDRSQKRNIEIFMVYKKTFNIYVLRDLWAIVLM